MRAAPAAAVHRGRAGRRSGTASRRSPRPAPTDPPQPRERFDREIFRARGIADDPRDDPSDAVVVALENRLEIERRWPGSDRVRHVT